jgi:hypothetical protein
MVCVKGQRCDCGVKGALPFVTVVALHLKTLTAYSLNLLKPRGNSTYHQV